MIYFWDKEGKYSNGSCGIGYFDYESSKRFIFN